MFHGTPLIMVEDADALADMVRTLEKEPVIGIDTESDSSYSYQEKVCLIQLSNRDTDWIVDPLKIDDLSPMGPLLSDPSIVKVLHGADYDIVCLKRDFGFEFKNLYDTLIAAQLLGMERIGLADLIERYFGIELDKQYQRHNWALRPLRPEHLDYARGDTHWMCAVHELTTRQLRKAGRMRHMREECRLLQKREWAHRDPSPHPWLDMKGISKLDERAKKVLRFLWDYRDAQARRMDRPVYKVIPNQVLLQLASQRPESMDALDKLFRGKTAMKRRHGKGLVKAVQEGLADDRPLPKPPKKKKAPRTGPKSRLHGRHADRAFAALKDWRNRVLADDDDLTAYMTASNSVLKSIASRRPYDLDELADIPDVREWQVDDWGDDLLDVLDEIDPQE